MCLPLPHSLNLSFSTEYNWVFIPSLCIWVSSKFLYIWALYLQVSHGLYISDSPHSLPNLYIRISPSVSLYFWASPHPSLYISESISLVYIYESLTWFFISEYIPQDSVHLRLPLNLYFWVSFPNLSFSQSAPQVSMTESLPTWVSKCVSIPWIYISVSSLLILCLWVTSQVSVSLSLSPKSLYLTLYPTSYYMSLSLQVAMSDLPHESISVSFPSEALYISESPSSSI